MTFDLEWLHRPAAVPDDSARRAAEARQQVLTKPAGALGRMEAVAIRLAALQATQRPRAERVHIAVFAADHGVAAEGVSAFPQAVTGEMLRNFARGGAAVCVIARTLGASLEINNLGVANDPGPLDGVSRCVIAPHSANFTEAPAMTDAELAAALAAGRRAAENARRADADLFVGGEMGIANTTAATALACALLDVSPTGMAGAGTGLSANGIAHKARVVQRALDRHRGQLGTPLETLRRLGGFEIAALVGSYVACAQLRLPVIVDGFITTSAALVATRCCPGAGDWLLYSHVSAESGHRALLAALRAEPILDLGMRLGEGSGAATAVPLLRLACALHNDMATFTDAGVSEKIE